MSFSVYVCVQERKSEHVVPRKQGIEYTVKYVKLFALHYPILAKTMD